MRCRSIALNDFVRKHVLVLNSYLLPREGYVTVENAVSEVMWLCDMVFQGTVLGPSLWNAFFGDVAVAAPIARQEVQLLLTI